MRSFEQLRAPTTNMLSKFYKSRSQQKVPREVSEAAAHHLAAVAAAECRTPMELAAPCYTRCSYSFINVSALLIPA